MMTACRPAHPGADPSTGSPPTDRQTSIVATTSRDSLCGDLAENGLRIPDTGRAAVTAELGRPDSSRSQSTPSKYYVNQDSLVDVFYPGLRLHYIVVTESKKEILQEADVSDNRYLKYPGLGVGASVEAVISALGPPEERTNDTFSYSCALHPMEGSTVYFHYQGERVRFVEYTYYVD
jgi:hypothetical protein